MHSCTVIVPFAMAARCRCESSNLLEHALKLSDKWQGKRTIADTVIYNALISACTTDQHGEQVREILKAAQRQTIAPNAITSSAVISDSISGWQVLQTQRLLQAVAKTASLTTETLSSDMVGKGTSVANQARAVCDVQRPRNLPAGHLPKGRRIQFFYAEDAGSKTAVLVKPASTPSGLWLLQSHGWLEGTLAEAFDPARLDESREDTWPLVFPSVEITFVEKVSGEHLKNLVPRRVLHIRDASMAKPPLLSLVLVRWGGAYSSWMDQQEASEGDWGKFGSPPSDEYMKALVETGVMRHPRLADENGSKCSVEIFSLFVRNSNEVLAIKEHAKSLMSILAGRKRTSFWMLWPAEWCDTGDPDYACYVERHAMFSAMRACEAAGLRSGFPHPADQFEIITSKSWMATLCLHPLAALPAATLVTKGSVVTDADLATQQTLAALEHIRRVNPFRVASGDPPAPSVVNQDRITKGVVKLGWSWENRYVLVFTSADHLQDRLKEMLCQPGCTANYCIVQEWVDFDVEMRLYFLPAGQMTPGETVKPERIECNIWGPRDEDSSVGVPAASFRKASKEQVLKSWSGDDAAWESATDRAVEIGNFLLSWLLTTTAQPVAMIRMDFMVKRLGPGRARVVFGEYCEMGACCLGWQEGPPTIWKAALDAVLK